MLDSGKDRIRFQYNPASKPVVIAVEEVGEIHVTSDDKGEIQQVESPEGRKVALEVTSTFQTPLDVIRPDRGRARGNVRGEKRTGRVRKCA